MALIWAMAVSKLRAAGVDQPLPDEFSNIPGLFHERRVTYFDTATGENVVFGQMAGVQCTTVFNTVRCAQIT